MPNAHWSDPAVVRHDEAGVATYYVVTSSIETSPNLQVPELPPAHLPPAAMSNSSVMSHPSSGLQILRSTDLVNYDVVGSVSRLWCGLQT